METISQEAKRFPMYNEMADMPNGEDVLIFTKSGFWVVGMDCGGVILDRKAYAIHDAICWTTLPESPRFKIFDKMPTKSFEERRSAVEQGIKDLSDGLVDYVSFSKWLLSLKLIHQ